MPPSPSPSEARALYRPTPDEKSTAYEPCEMCRGSGLGLNTSGEPDGCWWCHGDGYVRARDLRGRFTTRIVS